MSHSNKVTSLIKQTKLEQPSTHKICGTNYEFAYSERTMEDMAEQHAEMG